MYRKIASLLIIALISINIHARTTHNLIVQKGSCIYFYNFNNNTFKKILKLKNNYKVVSRQISDTIIFFQNINENEGYSLRYIFYLPENKLISTDTIQFSDKLFLSVVKNKNLSRKDTVLNLSRENGRYFSYSRVINDNYIYSKEGSLYTKKIKK